VKKNNSPTLIKSYKPLIISGVMFLICSSAWPQVGQRFPSEKVTVKDKVTGAEITVLTTSPADDQKIYQTHPQWTFDQKYIIFTSDRGEANQRSKVFAVEPETGIIIQLTDGKTSAGGLTIARKSNKLYYSGNGKLIEMDLASLFQDSKQGNAKSQASYERAIATLQFGGLTLDADEKVAYVGVSIRDSMPGKPASLSGIRAINLENGTISKVIDVPFRMGHIQANPFKSGEILFCWESGGDTPQRMWLVNADGSGYRPLYKERPDEWVSHEAWVDANTVYFNCKPSNFYTKWLPKVEDFRERGEGMFSEGAFTMPTGIFSINIRNNTVKVLSSSLDGHGYWHCNGTVDGKWAAGDSFDGNVYLINVQNGKKSILTSGNSLVFKGGPEVALFHAHPTFRSDGKQVLYQSGMYSQGENYDLMLVNVPANN